MKITINDIQSDRENTLRFVSSFFKNCNIVSSLQDNKYLLSQYQKLSNKYQSQLRKLIYAIQSNNDYRIPLMITQLNELLTYLEGASSVIKISTSQILINDIDKVLVDFIETKFSDLLKIDII